MLTNRTRMHKASGTE